MKVAESNTLIGKNNKEVVVQVNKTIYRLIPVAEIDNIARDIDFLTDHYDVHHLKEK